jgi:uncharacterized membrane protein
MTDFIQTEMLKEQLKSKHDTNHILHLVLSVITFGWWIIVWVLIAIINRSKRDNIEERFTKMQIKAAKEAAQ